MDPHRKSAGAAPPMTMMMMGGPAAPHMGQPQHSAAMMMMMPQMPMMPPGGGVGMMAHPAQHPMQAAGPTFVARHGDWEQMFDTTWQVCGRIVADWCCVC